MYIEPSTTIKIYHNVPLDNTYVHTIYFDSISAQNEYFHGNNSNILKRTLTKQSFQRASRGVMRVEVPIQDLYDCNYMAFQNERFGAKWFYAFITGREYVNNVTSEITFELDSLQTYWNEVTLLDSFVEREHSATDEVGDNIVGEPVDYGELYNDEIITTNLFNDFTPVLVTPYTFIGAKPTFSYYEGEVNKMPTCLHHYCYKGDTTHETMTHLVVDLMSLYLDGKADGVSAIYLIPLAFVRQLFTDDEEVRHELQTTTQTKIFEYATSYPSKLGSYTPKNKKLLTYPYNKFSISTMGNESRDYAYEFFRKGDSGFSVAFNIYANLSDTCSFKAVPLYYKGSENENFVEGITLQDFPLVAYQVDAYSNWFAQNKTRLGIQGINALLGVRSGAEEIMQGSLMRKKDGGISAYGYRHISRGAMNILRTGASGIADTIVECMTKKVNRAYGEGTTDGTVEMAMQQKDFVYIRSYLNPNDARRIDDFFTVYGYACGCVKVPNRNARPHWTYVKTADINLDGNCPSEDLDTISNIYNNGITFWRNPSEVGNYSLDNSPQ